MLCLLCACGETVEASSNITEHGSRQAISSKYTVDLAPNANSSELPANSDLLMADRDVAKYAETLCGLDLPQGPKRCDVYAQSDKAGTLVGYIAVKQGASAVTLESALTLGDRSSSKAGCYIGGKLSSSETGDDLQPGEASRDFHARTMYSAWEKEPGNWLVVTDEQGDPSENVNADAAMGVWYLERKGNNLRVQQERWNYCYKDSSVSVDDVFRRVISLTKKA
jgi:hypothetical protein